MRTKIKTFKKTMIILFFLSAFSTEAFAEYHKELNIEKLNCVAMSKVFHKTRSQPPVIIKKNMPLIKKVINTSLLIYIDEYTTEINEVHYSANLDLTSLEYRLIVSFPPNYTQGILSKGHVDLSKKREIKLSYVGKSAVHIITCI